jgi:hypothetical protein
MFKILPFICGSIDENRTIMDNEAETRNIPPKIIPLTSHHGIIAR